MRGWPALAIAGLLLAGCVSKDDTATSTSHSLTATAAHTTTAAPVPANATPVAHANHAPIAQLAWSHGNGTAALNVTFALRGHDADGDRLNWTLVFGDGNRTAGSALPANVTHHYKGGRYDVVLNVTDGRNATVARLHLNLTAAAAGTPDVFTGHVVAPDAVENSEGECLFALMAGTGATPGGVSGDAFGLVNAKAGWHFSFDVDGMVAQFQDASGYVGGKAASGTVPAGATSVLACSDAAIDTDYTLTIAP